MRLFSFLIFTLVLGVNALSAQSFKNQIVTADIDNFWYAYDQISKSSDSLERIKLINELYINKATDGLKGLISVRRYQDYEFVNNMLNYPKYWNSIRKNSPYLLQSTSKVEKYLNKLRDIYPALKPANIYFSIGAFRTGGTYEGNKVLFGAEFMLAQKNSVLDELPERIKNTIKDYAPYDIPLTAVHEYIHTQQKNWENQSIIGLCVAEGVAEFISTLITKKPLSPPVLFGKQNAQKVLDKFMIEIFRNQDVWNWLWSENKNDLRVNDLGYYIGYEICERYYKSANNKKKAIKDLLELDYNNEEEFAKLVDGTKFLTMTLKEIEIKYDSMRPIGWSEDRKRYTFEIESLKPNTTYGLIISNFAKENGGNRLAPYTIRFKTAD